ncbi:MULTISPECIES: DUF3613 domain-containing protein [Pseudomonas]|uniref:DUF3613 domain-containing protein n=1 Tax=Pseudomonas TaxID=286 RepID=UPI0030038243
MQRILMAVIISSACLAAGAAETVQPPPREQRQVASQAESWLAIQRDGVAASSHKQVLTSAERERSYQRWLDSYQHPIPEFFEQKQDDMGSD